MNIKAAMRNILRADYEQMLLLPASVEDWIDGQHPARFIREVVAQTPLAELGLQQPNEVEGGTCFGAELLLAVWLYGYFRKIRSTRALESACREDLGFVWLSGNHRPDHNALWRFWNANREGLRGFFKHTVRLAMELDLVGFALQAIDGTKLPATCAARQSWDKEHLERLLEQLDAQLLDHEALVDQAEKQRPEAGATLPEVLQHKANLRQKVREALERLEQQGRRHCHPQEPEAVRMNMPEGSNRFGYNAQLVVDEKAQIITAAEVVAQSNDLSLGMPMAELSRKNTGSDSRQLALDSGYCTKATVSQAQALGVDLLMPLPRPMQAPAQEPYHSSHFIHDEKRDVVICPQGQQLSFKKERWRYGQRVRQYRNGKACAACVVRAQCTRDRAGRIIDITGHETALAAHRQRMKREDAQQHYRRRAGVVEPVFARIKEHSEFRRFTLRGLQKVRVQWSMVCSVANLKRLFTFWKQGLQAQPA